jgi:DNA modification methylase
MKNQAKIYVGNNINTLKTLAAQSVQTVVTSPPYWGLRDYGTGEWIGGDTDCSHKRDSKYSDKTITGHKNEAIGGVGDAIYKDICKRCGAKREDKQIGLEMTPKLYVEGLCQVFDEVWRVLKDDGTLWLNLGDSYASFRDGKATPDSTRGDSEGTLVPKGSASNRMASSFSDSPIKHKDLVGIPWRVAFALQERGWYLRQDIIWAKPNPMPESVTDRCTKSHEYIFLLSKKSNYFFDHEAIKEQGKTENYDGLRNKRDVWTVTTSRYKEAHFATYPPELIEPCILSGSKEGDTVLDPFSGSGTTGVVALENRRNYIGLELNPDYANLSKHRITESAGLFGEIDVYTDLPTLEMTP